jgi:hypothetical protein
MRAFRQNGRSTGRIFARLYLYRTWIETHSFQVKEKSYSDTIFKVSRVGEQAWVSSSNCWAGPFSIVDSALKTFFKKFRDKTGNMFDADPFVPNSGK